MINNFTYKSVGRPTGASSILGASPGASSEALLSALIGSNTQKETPAAEPEPATPVTRQRACTTAADADTPELQRSQPNRRTRTRRMSLLLVAIMNSATLLLFIDHACIRVQHAHAFNFNLMVPPTFGVGAALFPPKNLFTEASDGDISKLLQASEFFVDAFWVGKVGGGAKKLNSRQREMLKTNQFMEFRGRYAGVKRGQSELIVCRKLNQNGSHDAKDNDVVGCAGIQVTPIPEGRMKGPPSGIRAPLMSNLAVSRSFRRRGIGEKLVKEAERIALREWGYDDCFLYVEKRNPAAVKLYKKLGYRTVWVDDTATTLLPTTNGNLKSSQTTLLCMRKRLGKGLLGRFIPF